MQLVIAVYEVSASTADREQREVEDAELAGMPTFGRTVCRFATTHRERRGDP